MFGKTGLGVIKLWIEYFFYWKFIFFFTAASFGLEINSLIGETKEVSSDVVLLLPFLLVFAACTAAIAVANAVADGDILLEIFVDVVIILFVFPDIVEFCCWAISNKLGEAAVVNKTRLRDATNGAKVESVCREVVTIWSAICCWLCCC